MSSIPWSLARLGYAVAFGVIAIVAICPWVQGPTALGFASFGATAASSIIDHRVSKRAFEWRRALALGLVCGFTAWLTLRWLTS